MIITTHYNAAANEAYTKIHGSVMSDEQWEWFLQRIRIAATKLGVVVGVKWTVEDAGGRMRVTHYRT